MKKVLIIGSCGAGKSKAAMKLAQITNLPTIHLDAHYWKPNWRKSEKNEWFEKVKKLYSHSQWIMDGNYASTLDYRINHADTIIFLFYPRRICLKGVIKRRLTTQRVDTIPGCKEKIDWELIKYIWTFSKRKAPIILTKLEKLKNKNVYIINNRKQLNTFFLNNRRTKNTHKSHGRKY